MTGILSLLKLCHIYKKQKYYEFKYFRMVHFNVSALTIPVEPGFLWHFVHLSLKTCSPYHEKQYIQKFKVISSQFPNNFFSASDIMEAVRGRFCFYGMNAIYVTSIPVELGFLWDFVHLKLKTRSLYHENL